MNLGGSISNSSIFQNILSIGYEFEVPSLSKLIYINNKGNDILVNTDITLGRIADTDFFEEDESEDIVAKKLLQQEIRETELNDIRIVPTVQNTNINDNLGDENNLLIQISTDSVDVTDVKYTIALMLQALCENIIEENDHDEDDDHDEDKEDKEDKEDMEDKEDKEDEETKKNNLYEFKVFENDNYTKTYKINFYHSTQRNCYMFTDVEWIATYYHPKPSENIILETFTNAIKNIMAHLDSLQVENGSFFVIPPEISKESNSDNSIIVNYPFRNLYAVPNSSVRYLDMYFSSNPKGAKKSINDIMIVPQMTFSCKIEYLFEIMKEIIKIQLPTTSPELNEELKIVKITNKYKEKCELELQLLVKIENITDKLIENYKKSNSLELSIEQLKKLKNYIQLILYKLYKYYNNYLKIPQADRSYFKNNLTFNSRHYNYIIYKKIKDILIEANKDNNQANILEMIYDIFLQPEILSNTENGLINDTKNIRINAFKKNNILDKTNRNYGNPFYSLRSYLDYFEDPLHLNKEEDEEGVKEEVESTHDWLFANSIDSFSSKMDIKEGDIVLTEIRSFPKLLLLYSVYELGNYDIDTKNINLHFYRNFIRLYDEKQEKQEMPKILEKGGKTSHKNTKKMKNNLKFKIKRNNSKRKYK